MNSKIYVKSREFLSAKSEGLLQANFTSRNRMHPETFRTEHAISNAPMRRMLECCRQDTKEAMICMDNKYALIKLTNLYQIKDNFSYFPQKRLM